MIVEEDHVGLQLARAALRFACVGSFAGHAKTRVLAEQRDQAAPEQRVIVDDDQADCSHIVLPLKPAG